MISKLISQKQGRMWYDSTYEVQRRVRFIETKYNNSGGEIGNYWLMGIVRVWDNENVLEMDSHIMWMYLKPLIVESKMI